MDPTPPVAPARVHHVLERLKKTGGPALNENQVHKWFQNRRYKLKAASVTSSGQAGDKVDQDIVQASAVAEAGMQSRQDRERPLCMLLDLSRAADDLLLPGAPYDSSDAGEATQKNIVRPAYDAVVQNGPQLLACPTTELGADTGQACPGEASHTAIAKPVPGTIVKAGKRWPRDYNDTELNAELDILQELPKEKRAEFSKLCNMPIKNKFQIMHSKLAPTLALAEDHVKHVETLREKFNRDCKRLGISVEEWQTYRVLENKKRKLEELFGVAEEGNKKLRGAVCKAKPGL